MVVQVLNKVFRMKMKLYGSITVTITLQHWAATYGWVKTMGGFGHYQTGPST